MIAFERVYGSYCAKTVANQNWLFRPIQELQLFRYCFSALCR